MVEGPGCKAKGEKMKPKIVRQNVVNISGNAVNKYKKKKSTPGSGSGTTPFHVMIGRVICDVQTLGKELFIFFQDFHLCLRVHFLMSGGFRLNGQKIDHEGGGESEIKELVLHLNKDVLSFTQGAVCMRSASESQQKIWEFRSLDICYEDFSHKRAVELFNCQGDRYVCDVLLDQLILPGVGNIIKNEALFDSGIKPDSKVSELTPRHITHLVKMTRDFSMIFYRCRRDGKPLHPYLKIYNKQTCKQCKGKVVITRMGDDSGRITSFCPNCQDNDLTRFDTKKLATKNSLLGWVNTTSSKQTAEWNCSQCTLINTGIRSNCEVCLAPKNKVLSESTADQNIAATNEHSLMTKNVVRLVPDLPSLKMPAVGTQAMGTKRKAGNADQGACISNNAKKPCFDQSVNQTQIPEPVLRSQSVITSQFAKKTGNNTALGGSADQSLPSSQIGNKVLQDSLNMKITVPNQKSNMKLTVPNQTKAKSFHTDTNGRICNESESVGNVGRSTTSHKPQGSQKWADESFPLCEGHGKRTVLRTVLKQGPNNGRKFYACPLNKQKQCGYFKWTENPVRNPVGPCER